jgi:hypothetical protein
MVRTNSMEATLNHAERRIIESDVTTIRARSFLNCEKGKQYLTHSIWRDRLRYSAAATSLFVQRYACLLVGTSWNLLAGRDPRVRGCKFERTHAQTSLSVHTRWLEVLTISRVGKIERQFQWCYDFTVIRTKSVCTPKHRPSCISPYTRNPLTKPRLNLNPGPRSWIPLSEANIFSEPSKCSVLTLSGPSPPGLI